MAKHIHVHFHDTRRARDVNPQRDPQRPGGPGTPDDPDYQPPRGRVSKDANWRQVERSPLRGFRKGDRVMGKTSLPGGGPPGGPIVEMHLLDSGDRDALITFQTPQGRQQFYESDLERA